ncbi:hypothetical protein A3N42_22685 [Klebsiella aerogenes]|nr:hypothetical protein A3N42_22685 [Klebsiella aerogenes]
MNFKLIIFIKLNIRKVFFFKVDESHINFRLIMCTYRLFIIKAKDRLASRNIFNITTLLALQKVTTIIRSTLFFH